MNSYLCVPLKGKRGGICYVSESAFHLVDGYPWYMGKNGYAMSPKVGLMHRRLMAAEDGEHVDHHNFNRLDNRDGNLRCCLPVDNRRRISRRAITLWPYRGVRFSYGKWTARIQINNKSVHLGSFDSAEEAARVFDSAAMPLGRMCNFGDKL